MKKFTLITLTTLLINICSTATFAQSQVDSLNHIPLVKNEIADDYFGVQFALASNHVSKTMRGIQWSFGTNKADEGFNGWQFALGGNINGGDTKGFQLGLGYNRADDSIIGSQFGAGFNSTSHLKGLQAAVGANIADKAHGVQVGLYNQAEELSGVQIGVVNTVLKERSHGLQAAAVNVSTSEVLDGIQLGVVNTAKDVEGLQAGFLNKSDKMDGLSIGFINVADSLDGLSIAPFSFIKDGIADFELSYSDNFQYNFSFRSGKEYFYFIWTGGVQNTDDFNRYGLGGGIGTQWNMAHKGLVKGSFELTHMFVKDDRQIDWGDGQNYLSQGRLNIIVNLAKPISLVAGPTLNYSYQSGNWVDKDAPSFTKIDPMYEYRQEYELSDKVTEHKLWLGFHAGIRIHLY